MTLVDLVACTSLAFSVYALVTARRNFHENRARIERERAERINQGDHHV